jgi:hypothetical protein
VAGQKGLQQVQNDCSAFPGYLNISAGALGGKLSQTIPPDGTVGGNAGDPLPETFDSTAASSAPGFRDPSE